MDQVLTRLGNAMAINRAIIAEAVTAQPLPRPAKPWPNRTTVTGAPNASVPKRAAMDGGGTD